MSVELGSRTRIGAAVLGVAAAAVAGTVIALTTGASDSVDQFCAAQATVEGQAQPAGGPVTACFDTQAELNQYLVDRGADLPDGYPTG